MVVKPPTVVTNGGIFISIKQDVFDCFPSISVPATALKVGSISIMMLQWNFIVEHVWF
jgi:hypothetical protein